MGVLDQNDFAITAGSRERLRDLLAKWDGRRERAGPAARPGNGLNAVHRDNGVPFVYLPWKSAAPAPWRDRLADSSDEAGRSRAPTLLSFLSRRVHGLAASASSSGS